MSSIFRRLSGRMRQDTSYINPPAWGEARGKNKPSKFIPQLILDEITDVENIDHLDLVARKDPIAYFGTYGIASRAMGDGFVIVDDTGEESEKNKAIQKELRILKAKTTVELAIAYARGIGSGYIYTGRNKNVIAGTEGGMLAELRAFSPRTCKVKVYDDYGAPVTMEVIVQVGEGDFTTREVKIPLPAKDFIFVVFDPLENNPWAGRSVLEPAWDDLTDARLIRHAMSWYDSKIGNGMFYVMTRSGIPDQFIARLNSSLEDHSAKRAMVFDGQHVEKFGFEGAGAGATDFNEHMSICYERIAAAWDIPADIIIGVTGGTNEAASTVEKASFKKLGEVRLDTEYIWREILKRNGQDIEEEHFKWNERFAHDEETRSKIDLNTASAISPKLEVMTVNEIRAEMGMSPVEDGDESPAKKEDPLTTFTKGFGGGNAPKDAQDAEQTQNKGGSQV